MIIFEPFTANHALDTGRVRLRASLSGMSPGEAFDMGFDSGGLRAAFSLFGESDGGGEAAIVVPDYGGGALVASLSGRGFSASFDAGSVGARFSGEGYSPDTADQTSFGSVRAVFNVTSYELPDTSSYGFVTFEPPVAFGYGGYLYEQYEDGLSFSDSVETEWTALIHSVARMADTVGWLQRLSFTLESSMTAHAAWAVIVEADVESTALFEDDLEGGLRMIMALASNLTAIDDTVEYVDALVLFTSAFVLRDTAGFGRDIEVESLVELLDEIDEEVRAVLDLVSEIEASDELGASLVVSTMLSSGAAFDDSIESLVDALLALEDDASFSVTLRLPGFDNDLFVGYAMNLRTAGVTQYDNYPFVDFATVGGVPLAISEDGLYRLEGDDDDGDPIAARIRTGLIDFGSEVLKRNPNMYLTLRSDGELVLKVITTDKGYKKENWYKLDRRNAAEPVEGRFDIAKGLVGVYWGYELVNMDGADFEFETIKSWPFIVQRRKSGR